MLFWGEGGTVALYHTYGFYSTCLVLATTTTWQGMTMASHCLALLLTTAVAQVAASTGGACGSAYRWASLLVFNATANKTALGLQAHNILTSCVKVMWWW